ncbi:PTS sugar transporter subunit IIA [Rhodococcus sp. IEGM 1409]|uniref:PTS sugar transporter subunit IIA n=1 Tax=Rhodococcus sp. IEGM 1409 TaxID=3047082 RepID=UPI0024B6A7A6|nr:PTS sugar transporter subunit IIA [Rhodococcus sp. IEGM 1409]MDI9903170.1 PTS sugar transporter subunit IIA [Rhodococcus sp. IEGM 1409]
MQPLMRASSDLRATDWKDAVQQAATLLVDAGAAESTYPAACVRVVEENGPYIVLAPGIALVHARPEDGGNSVGIAAARTTPPVAFGHPQNDPVDVLLAFCTTDPDAHVDAVRALAKALSSGLAQRLRDAQDSDAMTLELEAVFSNG